MNPYIIIAAIVVALAIFAGGYAKGHHDSSATSKAEIATQRANFEKQARAQEHKWQAKIDGIQAAHDKEITDAKRTEDQLRADVDAGRRQLRITVDRSKLPAAPSAAGGSDDATVELSAASRQTYYDLRASIISDQATLNACHAYARAVSAER